MRDKKERERTPRLKFKIVKDKRKMFILKKILLSKQKQEVGRGERERAISKERVGRYMTKRVYREERERGELFTKEWEVGRGIYKGERERERYVHHVSNLLQGIYKREREREREEYILKARNICVSE